MKKRANNLTIKFELPARFETPVTPIAPSRGVAEAELEDLKNRLLREELAKTVTLEQNVLLRRAANDATALVWLTPFPLLLLPALFEEKARRARTDAGRRARIRQRTNGLLTLTE